MALLLTLATVVPVPGSGGCDGPLLLTRYSPDAAIAQFVEERGGLPKEPWLLITDETETYAVRRWSVQRVRVRNNQATWLALLDDDPTYTVEADVRVTFEDGSAARLRWSSWRYGLALCPVVIGMGDGPPGSFTLLPDDTGAGGQR